MTISVYSESPSPLGTSVYRFDGVNVPAQFIPTLVFSAVKNNAGTNVNVRVKIDYPIVVTTDGITSAPNHFISTFDFTALQSVLNVTERTRVLDELIAFLTSHKASIINGSVRPITP